MGRNQLLLLHWESCTWVEISRVLPVDPCMLTTPHLQSTQPVGKSGKKKKTKISLFGSSLATPMKHLVGGTWNLPASPGCVAVSVRVRVFLALRGSMTESWLSVSVYRTARVGFRVHPSSLIA